MYRTRMIVAHFDDYKKQVFEARRKGVSTSQFVVKKLTVKQAIDNFFKIYDEMAADTSLRSGIMKEFMRTGCAPSLGEHPKFAPYKDISKVNRKAIPIIPFAGGGAQTNTGRIIPSTASTTTIDNQLLDNPIMVSRNQQNEQLEILDIEDLDDVVDPTFSRSVVDADNEYTSVMDPKSLISELEMNFLTSYGDEEEDEDAECGIDDDFDDDDGGEEEEEDDDN